MRADAATRAEAAKAANRPIHLVSVELGCSDSRYSDQSSCELNGGEWTAPIYITDFDRPISWGGNDYLAVGHLLGIGDISEASILEVSTLTLSLSGVDPQYIGLLLSKNYIDRPVVILRAFVDNTGQLLTTPFEVFRGRIDQPVISDSPTTTGITVTARNHLADFERKSGRHTNNAEMQRYFPGDTSFIYASQGLKEIRWGRE